MFEKGDPRINREGRPKGSLSLVSLLKKRLREIPKGQKETYAEIAVREWIRKGLVDKDFNALKEMVRYVDGMPKQKIEMEDNTAKENLKTLREITDVLNSRNTDSKTDS